MIEEPTAALSQGDAKDIRAQDVAAAGAGSDGIKTYSTGAGGAQAADAEAGDALPEGTGPEEKSPWDDPRLPWSGKPSKVDIICWAAIVGSGLYLLLLLPFRAALVGTHPVLGELLNGSTESIIAAAAFARVGKASLAVAILVAFPGLMKFDLVWWWAGRLWGEKVILLLSGGRKHGPKYMARVSKWGPRFSWPAVIVSPFLPIPTSIIYLVVGWAGMRLVTFLILDLIGTALWAGLLIGLGYELGHRAVVIAQTISHYSLWISIGIVALVVASQLRSSRRKR